MDEKILPAFEGNNNCIIFSSNEEFAPVTAVAIRSLLESGSRENTYDIILIHTDISSGTAEDLEKMAASYDNASLRLLDIGDIVSSGKYYIKNRQHFSKEAYYRLYIPFILDEKYEKALYSTSGRGNVFGFGVDDPLRQCLAHESHQLRYG